MKISNKWVIIGLFIILSFSTNLLVSIADAYEFKADFRLVPPDMVYVNNVPAGPIREIVDFAVKRAGHTIVWKTAPWKRTQLMASQGMIDILVRHSMNDKRRPFLSPILMGYQIREVIFVTSPNKEVEIKSFEDLQKFKIGQHRGYFYATQYNEADNINRHIVNSHRQLEKLLKIGRVDAVVMTSGLKGDLELLLSIPGTKIADYKIIFLNARYSSIPIKSPAIKYLDQISVEFFKMRRSGEMTQIMEKYGAKPYFQDFTTKESKAQEALVK